MQIIERWKSIKGYKGLYEVSDMGRVRSLNYSGKTGKVKVMSPITNHKGYLIINLCKNKKMKTFLVHRIVYESFIGDIPAGMTIDHINNVKTDNRLENLQLLTRGDNARKACNRQLDLIEADWPYREYIFPSSVEANKFFGYCNSMVKCLIFHARKRGENWINIRGTKYIFSQEA